MFITVDVIASRFGTLLAGMHIIAIALIGAFALRGAIRVRPLQLIWFLVLSLVLIIGALFGIRAFYTHVFVAPFTKGDVLAGLTLLGDPQPHRVYRDAAEVPPTPAAGTDALVRIRETGLLRACYRRSDYPSSFFNYDGELVGFDIEMAHRFARQLDAGLQFVPVESIRDAEKRIDSGDCDIFMSLMPIAPEMTLRFGMTAQVLESVVGLIVEDHRRRQFQTWDSIRRLGPIRIATSGNPVTRGFLLQTLPKAMPVVFKDNAELDHLSQENPLQADALLMPAEEGAAWTIRYPRFNLVTPFPIRWASFGYVARLGDERLLTFFNAWLVNARGDGTISALYRHWMLGEIGTSRPPRWSIARDVLGWFD